jgi:hypothetical protein
MTFVIAPFLMLFTAANNVADDANDTSSKRPTDSSSVSVDRQRPHNAVPAGLPFPALTSLATHLNAVELQSSWGYAMERNVARWKLIRESFAGRLPRAWHHNQSDGHASFRVMDLGADQGYFTMSMMRLLSAVAHMKHRRDVVTGFAVEKGGFGGAFWRQKEFSAASRSVHDEIREHFIAERKQQSASVSGTGVSHLHLHQLWICPKTITLPFLLSSLLHAAPSSSSCKVSVMLALSMLHWVEGVDGVDGFRRTICTLASAADSLIVELPHPSAKKTFGEKRYRGWYSRNPNRNITALLEETVSMCPSILASLLPKNDEPAGFFVRSCTFHVDTVGRTPWGRSLFREIHRIDQNCSKVPPASASSGDACVTAFGCFEVV